MEDWDIQITAKVDSDISMDELIKIAKKSGYKVIDSGKNEKFLGLKAVKNKVGHPKINLNKDKILELRNAGKTMAEISKELGVGRSSLYNYLGDNYPRKQLPTDREKN